MTPTVFSLLESTREQASLIAARLGAEHKALGSNATNELATAFRQGQPIIAVMASGIVIRALAPWFEDKHSDAPVVAVSPDGKTVVPLIGGHHGANQLAKQIAQITGGTAAITTASDTRFNIALDEPPEGLILANPEHLKPFMATLLNGARITTNKPVKWLENSNLPFPSTVIPAKAGIQNAASSTEPTTLDSRFRGNDEVKITVTPMNFDGSPSHLVYHEKTLCIGIGCERGVSLKEVQDLVNECLTLTDLAPAAIACIATIDLKADEHAINEVAKSLGVPVRLFTAKELNAEAPRLKNPSDIVMAEVGCPGVAEGAALAASGPEGELFVAKTKTHRATCSIALAPAPVTTLPGRARGKLSIVGIGPGSDEWRAPEATAELTTATDWVGYDLYLDLVANLKTTQTEHRFPLGKEEARVRKAFELAGEGKHVALVCSGDAAIYAMAALVYEVLDTGDLPTNQQRVEIKTLPGISAFQAASARAGALIGHDFCTISLSDLLTPWETIEKRLHAAAQGDFNIAFYNPRSLKRTDQLQKAVDILTPYRPPETPVIIASNLGRPTEKVTTIKLADFNPEDVDMLTIVLIGSSQSKIIVRGDGQSSAYTPRGYAAKKETS